MTHTDIITRRFTRIQITATRLAVTAARDWIMRHTYPFLEAGMFIRTTDEFAGTCHTIRIWPTSLPTSTAMIPIPRQIHAFDCAVCATVFITGFTRINTLTIFTRHFVCDMRRTIVRTIVATTTAVERVLGHIDALVVTQAFIFFITFPHHTVALCAGHPFTTRHPSEVIIVRRIR